MGKNLIIPGADFSENALPQQVLLIGALVVGGTTKVTMMDSSPQATVIMYEPTMNNTQWGTHPSSDYANKAKYALNDIPFGAKKIKATDTVKQQRLSMCLFDKNYNGLLQPSWSPSGVYTQELNIENYPDAVYYSLDYYLKPSDMSTLSIEFTF